MLAQELCSSEGDVSIRASSSSTTSSKVGRVQYCLRPSSGNSSLYWALVCNSTFHLSEAHVACRSNNPDYAAYNTLPGVMWVSSISYSYQLSIAKCVPSFPLLLPALFYSSSFSISTSQILPGWPYLPGGGAVWWVWKLNGRLQRDRGVFVKVLSRHCSRRELQ